MQADPTSQQGAHGHSGPTRVIHPSPPHNRLYKTIGASILAANRARYGVRGYRDPRPFPASDFDRAIAYDLAVIAAWRRFLGWWLGSEFSFAGLRVLELGPGADLGVGTALLALRASSYTAVDVNRLVERIPAEFHARLLARLEETTPGSSPAVATALAEIERAGRGESDRLRYLCLPSFDLSVLDAGSIDLVISHAAIEHFDNPGATFRQLAGIVRPDGLLVAQVDLMAHTRWIRERDPLNLYRFGDSFYRLASFRGAPNRVRPAAYERMMREAGWSPADAIPDLVLPPEYVAAVQGSLAPRFRDPGSRMDWLSVYLCARRAP
jgi:SAM-dependent methyltransferase